MNSVKPGRWSMINRFLWRNCYMAAVIVFQNKRLDICNALGLLNVEDRNPANDASFK